MANGDRRSALPAGQYGVQNSALAALGILASIFWGEWRPHATAVELGAVATLTMGLGAQLGHYLRDRRANGGSPSGPAAIGLVFLLALVGCAPTPLMIQHFDPGEAGGKTLEVRIDPSFYSRGCNAYRVSETGEVDLVTQQDGTSDWIGVRVLPTTVGDLVAIAVAAVAPTEMLKDALAALGLPTRERPALQPPSGIHGCEGIFAEEILPELEAANATAPEEEAGAEVSE